MPNAEISALCTQIIKEAEAISVGSDSTSMLESRGSETAERLKVIGFSHLENLQQLVIMLTSTMMPSEADSGDAGAEGSGGDGTA